MLFYGHTPEKLLAVFRTVLYVLKHHHSTLKPIIFKWFQGRCKFVGMDVAEGRTQPAQYRNEAFSKLKKKYMGRPLHDH